MISDPPTPTASELLMYGYAYLVLAWAWISWQCYYQGLVQKCSVRMISHWYRHSLVTLAYTPDCWWGNVDESNDGVCTAVMQPTVMTVSASCCHYGIAIIAHACAGASQDASDSTLNNLLSWYIPFITVAHELHWSHPIPFRHRGSTQDPEAAWSPEIMRSNVPNADVIMGVDAHCEQDDHGFIPLYVSLAALCWRAKAW